MHRSWQVRIWLDEGGGPCQASVRLYVDGDLESIVTWTPGPFETPLDVLDEALSRTEPQLTLPL